MSQILEESVNVPQETGQTGFDTGYVTESGEFGDNGDSHVTGHVTSDYLPPPPYQAALDGSDGAVSSGRSSNQSDSSGETGTAGYWLRQRR